MKASTHEKDIFRYYLSAFLSAARSVCSLPKSWPNHLQIMENEYKNRTAFRAWYDMKENQMKGDKVMHFLVKQRNLSIHQRPVSTHIHHSTIYTPQLNDLTKLNTFQLVAEFGDAGVKNIQLTRETDTGEVLQDELTSDVTWVFDEMPNSYAPENNVISICEDHFTKLEQIVNECETKFV